MTTIYVDRSIAASSDQVWRVLKDFGGVSKFMSSVDKSYILKGAASEGVGADRQCDLARGGFVRERVTEWRDGESYTVEIYEGAMPTKDHFGTIGVKASSPTASTAFMRMDYRMKYGPLGAMLDVVIMRRMIRKLLGEVLEELDAFVAENAAKKAA